MKFGHFLKGEYREDLPHGYGIYLFASGQKYEGEWALGKKHGWSIYTVDDGENCVMAERVVLSRLMERNAASR